LSRTAREAGQAEKAAQGLNVAPPRRVREWSWNDRQKAIVGTAGHDGRLDPPANRVELWLGLPGLLPGLGIGTKLVGSNPRLFPPQRDRRSLPRPGLHQPSGR